MNSYGSQLRLWLWKVSLDVYLSGPQQLLDEFSQIRPITTSVCLHWAYRLMRGGFRPPPHLGGGRRGTNNREKSCANAERTGGEARRIMPKGKVAKVLAVMASTYLRWNDFFLVLCRNSCMAIRPPGQPPISAVWHNVRSGTRCACCVAWCLSYAKRPAVPKLTAPKYNMVPLAIIDAMSVSISPTLQDSVVCQLLKVSRYNMMPVTGICDWDRQIELFTHHDKNSCQKLNFLPTTGN